MNMSRMVDLLSRIFLTPIEIRAIKKQLFPIPHRSKKFISNHKSILALIILYCITRLINLTLLPIFNDESIYLHWGWIETHYQGKAYLSLYDGKQPLLMWIFGMMQDYISDPLLAGRLVSVVTGFFALLGTYYLGKLLVNKSVALFAMLLYIITPVFVFYDRQALMESAIVSISVWLCYIFIRIIQKQKMRHAVILGLLMGVGLLIKLTPAIFLLTMLILSAYSIYKSNNSTFKNNYLITFLSSLIIGYLVIFPLIKQHDASNIITMNSRYAFTLQEIFSFPFSLWLANLQTTVTLLFWLLTPVTFIFLWFGIADVGKRSSITKYAQYWFLLPLLMFILFTREPSIRYIVAFLPLATIFCAAAIKSFLQETQHRRSGYGILIITILFPFVLTVLLLFKPLAYFSVFAKLTDIANTEYVSGFPSGYGIPEAVTYLQNKSKQSHITVVLRSDSGNPEDAMFVYLKRQKNITVTWLYFSCRNGNVNPLLREPTYLVSRNNILAGMERCVKLDKKLNKPEGDDFVGIYRLL